RPVENAPQGTRIENPDVDFATMARSMGVHAEGAITRTEDIEAALRRAIAVVKQGKPALIDIFTQNR
ncbi:MAG TPA: thiamine pyrophosphate-dependent enzyme, partial [Herbaspirillum sp.]